MGKLIFNKEKNQPEEIIETRPVDLKDIDDDIKQLEQELADKRAFRERVQRLIDKNAAAAAPAAAPAAPAQAPAQQLPPTPAAQPQAQTNPPY